MSPVLAIALIVQGATLCLLWLGRGEHWLRRPMTILVMASMVYDGLSQVLLAFPSVRSWDIYRDGTQDAFIAKADLIISAGMLALAVGYLLAGRGRQESATDSAVALAARVLDWRLLTLLCIPLAILTYEGRGYNGVATAAATATAASTSITVAFFVVLVCLAAVSFLLRHGIRWFLPVLATQSLFLAAAGERTPVVSSAITLILVLARVRVRPSGKQVVTAFLLTAVVVLAIAGVRAQQGRAVFESNSGLRARAVALGEDVTATQTPNTAGLVAQAAERLDGVSFTGAVLQARVLGYPQLDAMAVPESLLLVIPHAAWSAKPETGIALDPCEAEIDDFGLQQVNFLPTMPGLYAGFLTVPWLMVFLALTGVVWGLAERWIMARCTPARLVMLAGSVQAVCCYEAGLPAMLVALRSAAVIAVTAWLLQWLLIRRIAPSRSCPQGGESRSAIDAGLAPPVRSPALSR
jgi:hypothetical protein